jgi:hypothetical protein
MPRSIETSPGRLLRSFCTAPIRPQTYLNLVYVSLAFPLGLGYLIVVSVLVPLSLGLAVVLVGIPLMGVTVAVGLGLASLERRLTTFLLDVEIPQSTDLEGESARDHVVTLATDLKTWTPLVYLPAKFFVGMAALFIATSVFATGVSMLLVPLYYTEPGLYVGVVTDRPVELHQALYIGWNNLLVGAEAVFSIQAWRIRTLPRALIVAVLGGFFCLLGVNLLNALAWLTGRFTRLLLAGTYDPVNRFVSGSTESDAPVSDGTE